MVGFTLCALAALTGLVTAIPTSNRRAHSDSLKDKIKNVVVLVEENWSFDMFCGGLTYNRNNLPSLHLNCFGWLLTGWQHLLMVSSTSNSAIHCKRKRGWEQFRSLMIDRDVTNPTERREICADDRANNIAPDDPKHSISGINMQSDFLSQSLHDL